jgi:Domain of unknown function (DUF4268)
VAFPNEWRKSAIESKDVGVITERREAYRAFFQDLLDELRDKYKYTGARAAQPQNWYSFASGITRITYGFSFAAQGQARAEIYLDPAEAAENKALFDGLLNARAAIEAEFGEGLQWERLDDRRACRIAIYRPGTIEDDTQTLQDIKAWAIDRLIRIKKVFGPRVATLIKQ